MRRRTDRTKFRHSGAVIAATIIGFFCALPLATSNWFLTPILVFPLAVGLWAVRVGVDVTHTGLVVKGVLGSRQVAWADITGFTATHRRVNADVSDNSTVFLPSVRPQDVPRLMAAGNQQFDNQHDGPEIVQNEAVTLAG